MEMASQCCTAKGYQQSTCMLGQTATISKYQIINEASIVCSAMAPMVLCQQHNGSCGAVSTAEQQCGHGYLQMFHHDVAHCTHA
jgi:hypothetical protein